MWQHHPHHHIRSLVTRPIRAFSAHFPCLAMSPFLLHMNLRDCDLCLSRYHYATPARTSLPSPTRRSLDHARLCPTLPPPAPSTIGTLIREGRKKTKSRKVQILSGTQYRVRRPDRVLNRYWGCLAVLTHACMHASICLALPRVRRVADLIRIRPNGCCRFPSSSGITSGVAL